MKDSIRSKLENLVERLDEVNHLLSDPEIIGNQDKFRQLTKEHSQLTPVVETFNQFIENDADLQEAKT